MTEPNHPDCPKDSRFPAGGEGGEPTKWEDSDPRVLTERLYQELRVLASRRFQGPLGIHKTLQPTVLVNEAYLRLQSSRDFAVKDKAHFFCLAARVMRQILADHARSKHAEKRGGDWQRVSLDQVLDSARSAEIEILDLEKALQELSRLSETKARLVELRFFAGLTETESAEALGISRSEATRQWRMTKAWLSHHLRAEGDGE